MNNTWFCVGDRQQPTEQRIFVASTPKYFKKECSRVHVRRRACLLAFVGDSYQALFILAAAYRKAETGTPKAVAV
jgi:hypothetical protein